MLPLPPILENPILLIALMILAVQGQIILNYVGFAVMSSPPRLRYLILSWIMTKALVDMGSTFWPPLLALTGVIAGYIHFIPGHMGEGTGLRRFKTSYPGESNRR